MTILRDTALPPPGFETRRSPFVRAERWLEHGTEFIAALLVVADMLTLLAGVVSRYAFHRPLVWSDELASILFLWLTMVGSVIALQRGEHMRLTVLIGALPPRGRAWIETFATLVVITFLALLLGPGWEYVGDEGFITTPALGIANSWRVGAIEIGFALMAMISVARLFTRSTIWHVLSAVAAIALVAAALWACQPMLIAMGKANLVVFFCLIVFSCVLSGVPIAFSFGTATLAYLLTVTQMPVSVIIGRLDEGSSSLVLLAIPLFVFLGLLTEMTGMARAMVNFLGSLFGHVRGGLQYVLLGAICLVSGISGSKAADMAAVAPVLFPEMTRRGAKPGELVALLSASAAMSETIPPSLVLITIGSVTGVSIAALFTAGLLPAVVLAVALGLLARFRARDEDMSQVRRAKWGEIGRTFIVALPALVLPFIIRAAVVGGIATATEVSTLGVVYTGLVGLIVYRQFDWKRVYPMLVETAALSGAILIIIGTATAMAWALTQSGFSRDLVAAISSMPGGKYGFLLASVAAFVVLGSLLEGIPAIVLFGPLLFPAARAVGVNDVHYAIVVILAMGIGLFAPPFGVGFYSACAIGKVPADEAMGRMWPYILVLVAAVLEVAYVPWISLGFL